MSDHIVVAVLVVMSIMVVVSTYISARNHSSASSSRTPLPRGTMTIAEIDLIYGPKIDRMRAEMEASEANCAKKIKELEGRIEFLLSVIISSEKSIPMKSPGSNRGLVLVMSNESEYASAVKLSGVPVSIVGLSDLPTVLSMLPRDSDSGDYGVVLAVMDDWSIHGRGSIDRVGDVSNRVFVLVGHDSDRVASFLGLRSRGAVAVNATALIASQNEKTGGTRRDSVIEGNIAAFCAAFVSSVVKDGVSVDLAYERAKEGASEWVADRTRLYR